MSNTDSSINAGLANTVRTERPLVLPDGTVVDGTVPVVVIGPNGSGKTTKVRDIRLQDGPPIEIVNALRSTQISDQISMVNPGEALSSVNSHRQNARNAPWNIITEFEVLLSKVLADEAEHSSRYKRAHRQHEPLPLELTVLERMEALWRRIFPGRSVELTGYRPTVTNSVRGEPLTYSANRMSDGEKAALYLMAKVLIAEPGAIAIDEPETHLHSLLAVQLWDELESARPDLRFIYVTHDITFALSRRDAVFLLANPERGLSVIDLKPELTREIVPGLLGSASVSFYATRLYICEGDESSLDAAFFRAWFRSPRVAVASVGSCQRVIGIVTALRNEGLVTGVEVTGIIDRDYHPDAYLAALDGIIPLGLHEVESLFAVPEVIAAVCRHLLRPANTDDYITQLRAVYRDSDRHRVILDRWKRRMEPNLETLLSSLRTRNSSIEEVQQAIPDLFDRVQWPFSPETILEEERTRIETDVPSGSITAVLKLMPGKQALGRAANYCGLSVESYTRLVIGALSESDESLLRLAGELETALSPYLPPRSRNTAAAPTEVASQ